MEVWGRAKAPPATSQNYYYQRHNENGNVGNSTPGLSIKLFPLETLPFLERMIILVECLSCELTLVFPELVLGSEVCHQEKPEARCSSPHKYLSFP